MNPIDYKDFFREELENERVESDYSGVYGGKYGIRGKENEPKKVEPKTSHPIHNSSEYVSHFNDKKKDIQTYAESEGRTIGQSVLTHIDKAVHDICDHMKVKGDKHSEDFSKRCVCRGTIHSIMDHLGIKSKNG